MRSRTVTPGWVRQSATVMREQERGIGKASIRTLALFSTHGHQNDSRPGEAQRLKTYDVVDADSRAEHVVGEDGRHLLHRDRR